MTTIYRTSGAWGAGKGSNLTAAEVDENFYGHEQRIGDLETSPTEPNQIANIIQTGDTITIVMEDATTFGPFTLPRSLQRPTQTLAVTGTSLTPAVEQSSYYFRCTNAAGCAIEIPANADEAFLIDAEIHFRQCGAGALTFAGGIGVTLNIPEGFLAETAILGAVVTAKKVATNAWDLFGLLAQETTA
ncbi:hypothetical protein GR217_34465 [Rhizobium leguminosarum]|uniref:Uncharacterized protein n=1 Tax=Rhizobium ruizarguesonis TaxID=2081791 RepID=A0AAE5C6B1_9HYPH|nr:hypothetical protein [Rhizobium ruizarguesonis]NEI52725.1 hypothetical protein [Rhizobium ruizarguesonis]